MVSRVYAVAAALLMALFGMPSAAPAVALPTPAACAYTYDNHVPAAVTTGAANERGPPSAHDHTLIAHSAVDYLWHGASVRPSTDATASITTYDHPTGFARPTQATDTNQEEVHADRGGTTSPARSDVAANAGDDVVRALSATERRTLDDALRPDKLDHIFDPKHNFQPLVQQFGSREAAMEQIVRSIGGPLPQAGRFEIAQRIGGQAVVIRGAVVDGIPRIGTAFTP